MNCFRVPQGRARRRRAQGPAGIFKMIGVRHGRRGQASRSKLTGAATSSRSGAMEQIIFEGKAAHPRHCMATRMPRSARSEMAGSSHALAKVDLSKAGASRPKFSEPPPATAACSSAPRAWAASTATASPAAKSLGMPGAGPVATSQRLPPHGWFRELLHDPAAKNPGTPHARVLDRRHRPFPDVGRRTRRRRRSTRCGRTSRSASRWPSPPASQPNERRLRAGRRRTSRIVHRTFMAGASARWRSSSAFPTASTSRSTPASSASPRPGRAGSSTPRACGRPRRRANEPLGTDVIDIPPGRRSRCWPAQATVARARGRGERNVGGRFHGYHTDKPARPTSSTRSARPQISERRRRC